MNRYIVLFKAPLDARERLAQATPAEAAAGMKDWADWAERLGPALLDPGRPIGAAVSITAAGSGAGATDVVGMSIIGAGSMKEALELVGDHHHLRWAEDCEILVLEEIQIPELQG